MLRRPSRKNTDDTLVDSPTSAKAPSKWFPLHSKRLSGDDSETDKLTGSPVSPRFPRGKLVTRSESGGTLLDADGRLDEERSDDASDENNVLGSPRCPSPSNSPESPSPRKLKFFSRHHGRQKSIVDTEERHISPVAVLFAKTVVQIAEASNVPYLKGVAGLALLIIETSEVRASLSPNSRNLTHGTAGLNHEQGRLRANHFACVPALADHRKRSRTARKAPVATASTSN